MGLMDKVKAQATQIAQQTREAAQEGKAKIDAAQANRRGDAMLRQLGAAVFAERTGRGTPDSQAKIDQLITDISAYERENGLNLAADPAQNLPQQPSFPPDPATPFPGPAGSTFPGSFPDQGTTSFPDAGTTSFPGQAPTSFPDQGGTGFPETRAPDPGTSPPEPGGGFGGFPPES